VVKDIRVPQARQFNGENVVADVRDDGAEPKAGSDRRADAQPDPH
jgi:hypothetical protein